MGKTKSMLIGFPAGGQEKKLSFRQDKPYTTFDCLNVRPQETIEGRERGGSRPGLQGPQSRENFGSEIRLLAPMSFAPPRGGFMILENYFPGSTLADAWEEHGPIFGISFPLPILSGDGLAGTDSVGNIRTTRAVHTYTDINTSRRYTIWMYIVPHEGAINPSVYNILARMSTVSPNYYTDGLGVSLWVNRTDGYIHFVWQSRVGGSSDGSGSTGDYALADDSTGDWFGATFDGNTIVSATFKGITETINMAHSNHSGSRVGLELHSGPSGGPFLPIWISAYNIEYFAAEAPLLRTLLVASAGGNLYEEWSARE